jgi:hypothetical protein
MTKLTVAFRDFTIAPKNDMLLLPNICAFAGETVESDEALSYGSYSPGQHFNSEQN